MKGIEKFTPHGTARERFSRSQLGASVAATKRAGFPCPEVALDEVAHDMGPESVYLAWEIARLAVDLEPSEQRALFFLVLACLVSVHEGSTRLPVGPEDVYWTALLERLGASAEEVASAKHLLGGGAVPPVVGAPGDYVPLIFETGHLYQQRLFELEDRVAESLRVRQALPPAASEAEVEALLADVWTRAPKFGGEPIAPNAEQRAAVQTAVTSHFALVTGGPGTGKTSIVVAMLRALARQGVALESIALAAPTGKAAKRMQESIEAALRSVVDPGDPDRRLLDRCPEPKTLHRLLRYSAAWSGFYHHSKNPLSEDVVLVDEASMIDLELMERLLGAVRPEARLVLLGDADQLPSVGAGALFRDLLSTSAACRLEESHRARRSDPAGRHILKVAACVCAGDADAAMAACERTRRVEAGHVAFHGVEVLSPGAGGEARRSFVDRWFAEKIGTEWYRERVRQTYRLREGNFEDSGREEISALFRHVGASRILTLTREAPGTGAEPLNRLLGHQLIESFDAGPAAQYDPAQPLRSGVPIMVQKNDYDLGLFNGDQGLVLRVAERGSRSRLRAVFPKGDGFSVYHLEAVRRSVKPCFAMTVHKAQGSEFDCVLLLLPDKESPLLTREIIYTAITRSRTSAVVIGTDEMFAHGVGRKIQRFCGVAEKVGAERNEPR